MMNVSRIRLKVTAFAVVLAAVVFWVSGIAVSAQMDIFKMFTAESTPTPSPTPSPTASPTPTPTPIALADVVDESEATENRIVEIKREISEDSSVSATRRSLESTQKFYDRAERRAQDELSGVPSLESLSELESRWKSYQSTIGRWQADLKSFGAEIDQYEKELGASLTAWKALKDAIDKPTRPEERAAQNKQLASASPDGSATPAPDASPAAKTEQIAAPVTEEVIPDEVPPAIRDRINQTISDIEKAQKAVTDAKTELLDVQSRISRYEKRVNDTLDLIEQRRDNALSNLASQDSPPLWSYSTIRSSVVQEPGETFTGELSASASFLARSVPTFIFVVVVFLICLLVLSRIRRRTKVLVEEEPELERVFIFFEKPVMSAFFLAMLTLSASYTQAPELLKVAVLAAILVPGYKMLRRVLDPPLYTILNALVAFYFFDAFRHIFDGYPFFSRLLFCLQVLAAVALVVWLYKREPSKVVFVQEHERLVAFLKKIVGFTAIPFSIALAANVFGFVGISRVLAKGILDSAYSALFLYAFYLIFVSLVVFVLRVKPFSRLKMVANNRRLIVRKISRVMAFLLAIAWFFAVSARFYLEEKFVSLFGGIFRFSITIGSFSITVGDILVFLFIVWLAFAISRLVRFVLEEDIYTRVSLSSGVPYAISTILHYLVLVAGFTIAILSLGIDLTKFTILAGAFGVGLGFGLQNVVENFVSGMILLFERPVTVGDVIQRGDQIGDLKRIGLRASVLGTPEGAEVIVPNGHLLSEEVTNWTPAENRRRLDINVGVAYGTDPEKVLRLLEEVGKSHPGVEEEPKPLALFMGFGASSLDFQLRAWAHSEARWWVIRSDLNLGIYKALADEGIEIPFPQHDVFIKNADKLPPRSGGDE